MNPIIRTAPGWLRILRATPEWQAAHTPLDDEGRAVVPVFSWASDNSNPSFIRFIRWMGTEHCDRVAISDYSRVRFSPAGEPQTLPRLITYAELVTLIERDRAFLRRRGLGHWDRLAICLPNRIEVLTLQYAAWSLGVIVSPINPEQKDRIGEILKSADHQTVFVDCRPDEFAAQHGLDQNRVAHVDELHDRIVVDELEEPESAPEFDDPVLILHTSGTTGKPKGAMLSPKGLLTGALALREGFELAGDDRFLMVNPLHHINSIAFALGVFGVGAEVVIPPFGQHWPTAAAAQVTISSMVQRHLTPIVSPASPSDHRNLHCVERLLAGGTLKWIAVGSGPLAPDVQSRLLDLGILVLFRWGMSENYLGSTNMRPGHSVGYYRARLGSTGPTNRYLNLAVRGEDGEIRPTGRGQLLQRGNIMVAYSSAETSAGAFAGGWHDTGDIAVINEEKHVYIVGRTKETIIRSGENIYPQDVDNHLMLHPRVIFAQTVGYPDPDHSEEIGAFVVVDEGDITDHELMDHAAKLGTQKRPKKLVLLSPEDERALLKYTGPGKPQRLVNQLTFWRMHLLDEAGELLIKDGHLPAGSLALAVPDGAGVGLLIMVGEDSQEDRELRLPDLLPYIHRGSRVGQAELTRLLRERGLEPHSLLPTRTWVVQATEEKLHHAQRLNRARIAAELRPDS